MIGYFGKIPSHGDFVGRGLPPALVAAWDQWLQQCIHESQQQLGDQWLTHYLTSPVWRFAISPGILGPEGLGGVMMPSVDRVGRYFPLMIAATGAPPLLDWFQKQVDWYDEIEKMARAWLDPGIRLEQFVTVREPILEPNVFFIANRSCTRLSISKNVGERAAAVAMGDRTLWWNDGGPNIEPSLLICSSMPLAHTFVPMLDGSWATSALISLVK